MRLFLGFCAVLLLGACSFVTDGDRQLARDILQGASGCLYVQGSGGAGAGTVPVPPVGVPLGGGFGQGSMAAARSQKPDAKMKCGPDGASVD